MCLTYNLKTGLVRVGIVPSIPIEGVHFLLGNDIAGDKVILPHVTTSPVEVIETEKLQEEIPGIFPSCVITKSKTKSIQSHSTLIDSVSAVSKSDLDSEETHFSLADTFLHDLVKTKEEDKPLLSPKKV